MGLGGLYIFRLRFRVCEKITVIAESPTAISAISADRRFLNCRAGARTPLARGVADIFCRDFVAPKNSAMTVGGRKNKFGESGGTAL